MKKIVFVTNQFKTGGVETAFVNLSLAVDNDIILIPIQSDSTEFMLMKLPENVTLMRQRYQIRRNAIGIVKTIVAALDLRKKFSKMDVDIVAINYSDTLRSLLFSYLLSPNLCYSWIHCSPLEIYKSSFYHLYLWLLKKMRGIVFICNSQYQLFCSLHNDFNNENSRRIICTNFVDLNRIDLLKRDQVDYQQKYFLMVARMDMRSKDFETLFKAYALLPCDIRNEYRLVLIGDGPDRKRIETLTTDYGIVSDVVFAGEQENPYKYMYNASIYIHASKSEGFSIVLLEALACGCTVVATDCPVGPDEILGGGKYGYLSKLSDPIDLEKKICDAIQKPFPKRIVYNRAKELCEKGIQEIREFLNNA